jgi:hypothetical protein
MDRIERALEILGLGPNATPEDIKQAYRDLAKVWHPDRFPTDSRVRRKAEDKLKEINWANEQLQGYDPAPRRRSATSGGPTASARPAQERRGARTPKEESASPPSGTAEREESVPTPKPPGWWVPRWAYIVGAILAIRLVTSLVNQSTSQQEPRQPVILAPKVPSATQPSPPQTVSPELGTRNRSTGGASRSTTAGHVQPTAPPAVIPVPKDISPEQSRRVPPESFTVGSSKDEVLTVQGTPTEFNDRVWKYGSSSVFFSGDQVTSWDMWPGSPLKVRMLPSQPVGGTRGYFTVGSTKDEVLTVQGTPTEFNDRVWKYGSSSVFFSGDQVTSWDVWPGSPLKVRLESGKIP